MLDNQTTLVSRREYNRVFSPATMRGFEPIGMTTRAIPRYADMPEKEADDARAGVGSLMFGVAEVFFGLLVVLCMIGLVSVGLFIRGR